MSQERDSRCVECGRPKSAHDPVTLKCKGSAGDHGKVYGTMDLPAGKTCSDCKHLRFCSAFIGEVAANTSCDWFPVRFVQKQVQHAQ